MMQQDHVKHWYRMLLQIKPAVQPSHRAHLQDCTYLRMILVKPNRVFEDRIRRHRHSVVDHQSAPIKRSAWQRDIVQVLEAAGSEPMLVMSVVNQAVALMCKMTRRERERIKVEIICEIGRMIRQEKLERVQRRFVRLKPEPH